MNLNGTSNPDDDDEIKAGGPFPRASDIKSFLDEIIEETSRKPQEAPKPDRLNEDQMRAETISFWRAEVRHLEAQAARADRIGLERTAANIQKALPFARQMLAQAQGIEL